MSIYNFSQWLSSTAFSQLIQGTDGAIAGIQMIHIITLATLVALVLVLALRFIGRGLVAESMESLSRRFVPAIRICVIILLVTGLLLIVAEPTRTLNKPVFYLKMVLLVVALVITQRFAKLAHLEPPRDSAARMATVAVYLLIWCGIIAAGRLIAYY
jgi:putative copper export protein